MHRSILTFFHWLFPAFFALLLTGCTLPIVVAEPGTPTPTPAYSLSLDPPAIVPDAAFVLSGSGWVPERTLLIGLRDPQAVEPAGSIRRALATVQADSTGAFSTTLTLPDGENWSERASVLIQVWDPANNDEEMATLFLLARPASQVTPTATPSSQVTPAEPVEPVTVTATASASATQTTVAPASATPTSRPAQFATATPTRDPRSARVTSAALNLRTGPGTVYPVVTSLGRQTLLRVTGQDASTTWLRVEIMSGPASGSSGWVARGFTDFAGSAPVLITPVPPATVTPTPIAGWHGEYFANRSLSGSPSLVRVDRDITFDWDSGAPATILPVDNFSVRWRRTLNLPSGTYRFLAVADDGVRVWLGDDLIIDQWRQTSTQIYVAERSLRSGSYPLRIEYFEADGLALVEFRWERAETETGWRGEYFNNQFLSGPPTTVRNDTNIDFQWLESSPAPGIPSDGFSVRWTRTLTFDEGLYRFYARMDDGMRIFVDNRLVLSEWRDGGDRTLPFDISLGQGSHTLRVEYYDRTGPAFASLRWEKITAYPEWTGEYWSNPTMSGSPTIVRNDRSIDFAWGSGSPDSRIPENSFSARWSRNIRFDAATYRFSLTVDDGARVYLDGALLLDEWRDGQLRTVTVETPLSAGAHTLRVEFYERSGGALIQFGWEKVLSPIFHDWKGEYWNNPTLSGTPALVRNDQAVRFDWGRGAPGVGLSVDGFSARWSRTLALTPGVYRISARADDGLRIFIDGNLVINEWRPSNGSELYQATLNLGPSNRFVIEYYDDRERALVEFNLEPVTITATPTPTASASPTPTATVATSTATATVATSTSTPTSTPTATATTEQATSTPTPTSVSTFTPTATPTVESATSTPTASATPTVESVTSTPTPSATPTVESATSTPTSTPTAESSPPTSTPTPTATTPPDSDITGIVSGLICGPDGLQSHPAMTLYLAEVGGTSIERLTVPANQGAYRISLDEGDYVAYGWTTGQAASIGYTAAVACGMGAGCTDHTLLPFTVIGGRQRGNVDVCDWEAAPVPTLSSAKRR